MISSAATPATGEPSTTRGVSPQASAVVQPDVLEALPDRGDVLDPDPVQLDVLPVGDVGGVAAVRRRDVGDGPQLGQVDLAAVAADAQHEVLVVELVRLQDGRTAAVDAGLALRVEAPPAHPAAQVGRVDGGEPAVGVDVLDPRPDVQAVVVLLEPLVGVERLAVAQRPLALALGATGGGAGGLRSRRHVGRTSFGYEDAQVE